MVRGMPRYLAPVHTTKGHTPFVPLLCGQYLAIPRTILHFRWIFHKNLQPQPIFDKHFFYFFLQNADQTLQNGQIGNPR